MTSPLFFQPAAPWPLVVFLCGAAIVAALLSFRRGWSVGLLRLAAAIALAGLVLDPQIQTSERTPLRDVVAIVTDVSASLDIDGRAEVAERTAALLKQQLGEDDNVDIIEARIDGEEETLIGAGLSRALSVGRDRLAGAFLITDGRSADAVDPAQLGLEAPLHVVYAGRENEIDRKITLLTAPRYGIVNSSVDVSFRIDDLTVNDAPLSGERDAEITLRVNGEEVLSQPVPVGAEVKFAVPLDRPGKTIIELEAAGLDAELTARNNLAVLPISSIRDRLRVLLISGEPHPGERAWRNLLKSDPAIDLVHFTILSPAEKRAVDNVADERELALIRFPQDELFIEKLTEFDLVIFDRYTYRGVLNAFHFDNIARYVEGGGAVLVSSGPEFAGATSLAARRNFGHLLPAIPLARANETPYRPDLSPLGERHPVTEDLPEQSYWGRWLRIMPAAPRAGQVLMLGPDNAPLLILDRVEDGRVGLILSDHVWLWARGFDGGGPHSELLRRISHWLMKEPELEEERLILTQDGDALVIERRTLAESVGEVALTMPDGEVVRLTLPPVAPTGDAESDAGEIGGDTAGVFRARLDDAPRGLYRARNDDLFAIGQIGLAAPPEIADVLTTDDALAEAMQTSGGGAFQARRNGGVAAPTVRWLNARAGQRHGGNWAGVVRRRAERIDSVRLSPLAPPAIWLALAIGFLILAWLREGRHAAARKAS